MSSAVASYRKARAVELALAGCSYDEIAQEVGYSNRGTAWHTVQDALAARRLEAVDEYRDAELVRLGELERRLWSRVMAGDVRAVMGVLAVIDKRCRLLGLYPTQEPNRCTCDCPMHGSHGSWRPTLRLEDAPFIEEPTPELIAEVEERMVAWVAECGLWTLFQVMTMLAQVMELAANDLGGAA